MSDKPDKSQKTEDPTAKRLQQAREKGQIASSKEVSTWMMLAAGALAIATIFPLMGKDILRTLGPYITSPHDVSFSEEVVQDSIKYIVRSLAVGLGIYGLLMLVMAMGSQWLQNGLIFSADPIKPKLEKISVLKGIKRMFSLKSLVEFGKGVLKLCIVGGVLVILLKPIMNELDTMIGFTPEAMVELTQKKSLLLFIGTLSVLFIIAALDLAYQKFNFQQDQRMTRQEVKDEYKQSEGDPMVKGKLRQIRQERSRQRMMAAVPEASMIITNPTHYAVALKYTPGQGGAPKVLAKGIDNIALKIREVAKEHKIPIIENPPLARALYASTEIDDEIPFEHFKAVAKVIGFLMKKGKLK